MLKKKTDGILTFHKIIYNWKEKTQKQILAALKSEVDAQLKAHKGYEVKQFSKPNYKTDGSLLYIIQLQKNKLV